MKFRLPIKSLLAIFGVLFIVIYATQFYRVNVDSGQKSRRGRYKVLEEESNPTEEPDLRCKTANEHLHAFYYPWYGTPDVDGEWVHWNHAIMPHWEARVNKQFLVGQSHTPPDDLGTNFYPLLGPYSSANVSVIDQHLQWACEAGIGTFVVSYFAHDRTDDNGRPFQHTIRLLFQRAAIFGIKIAFHMEPYEGRTAHSVIEDVKLALGEYGTEETFARDPATSLPIFYIYDSYQIKPEDWASAIKTVRSSEYDAYLVGLLVEMAHLDAVMKATFNAAYSYFASINFSYGCTPHNWEYIYKKLKANKMDFIPSVGPGYEDTAVRPWNKIHTQQRENGDYYSIYFQKAISLRPKFITVTSFNEWHEGTQIEPAIEYTASNRIQNPVFYLHYQEPYQYLKLTANYAKDFRPAHF